VWKKKKTMDDKLKKKKSLCVYERLRVMSSNASVENVQVQSGLSKGKANVKSIRPRDNMSGMFMPKRLGSDWRSCHPSSPLFRFEFGEELLPYLFGK